MSRVIACMVCSLWLLSGIASANSTYTLPSGETLDDPTRPPIPVRSSKKQEEPKFELNYILNAKERRQAIINGQRVSEGDTISGARVKKIDSDRVTLLLNGQARVLTVSARPSVKN